MNKTGLIRFTIETKYPDGTIDIFIIPYDAHPFIKPPSWLTGRGVCDHWKDNR